MCHRSALKSKPLYGMKVLGYSAGVGSFTGDERFLYKGRRCNDERRTHESAFTQGQNC